MASAINPDLIFGDTSPFHLAEFANYLDYSNTYLYALGLVLGLMGGRTAWSIVRIMMGGDKNKGTLIWDQFGKNIIVFCVFVACSMPLMPLSWVGYNSTLSVAGLSAFLAGGYKWTNLFADEAAKKLVSLNPMTAPQMPLLRAQADAYFEGADKAIDIARKNVDATGGAFDSAGFRAQLLHGAAVAYASAGLNNANTPLEELPKRMQNDLANARRMQDMWTNNPGAAMTECVGNTLLADTAKDLVMAQNTGGDLPTAKEWDDYYQAAAAYLVGGNNAGGNGSSASNFGSQWGTGEAPSDPGSEVQLPPLTDILRGASPRDIVINGTAYAQAFSPGVSLEELSQPLGSVKASLDAASDDQQRANLTRLLAAAQGREKAEAARQTLRNQMSAAYESLAAGFSLANVQADPSKNDLFQLALKNAQGEGADLLRSEVSRRNLVTRCQAYGGQVKAVDIGFRGNDLGTRISNLVDSATQDPMAAARMVGDGGWLKLGIYYLSTAESYRNAYTSAESLRMAAASYAGKYFSSDPVAVQATNARTAAEMTGTAAIGIGTGMMAKGSSMAEAAGKQTENAILEAGSKAGSKFGEFLGAVGRKVAWWGWLVDIAAFVGQFLPYMAFLLAVMWWFIRLVFYFQAAPFVVLFMGMEVGVSQSLSPDFIGKILMKTAVFIFMPVFYVIGWEATFFGTGFLNVLIAATNGQTGVGEALKNLGSLDLVGVTMASGMGGMVAKFILTIALGVLFFKVEGWISDYVVGIATRDADPHEAKIKNLA